MLELQGLTRRYGDLVSPLAPATIVTGDAGAGGGGRVDSRIQQARLPIPPTA